MRLWTLHPQYLDSRGLVALWRESLLAQAVLLGQTEGYRHHPQLLRFREHPSPLGAIGTYLFGVHQESERRGFHFDSSKINPARVESRIEETEGQVRFEWHHLMHKLQRREPRLFAELATVSHPESHPLFHIAPGEVRDWEHTP